MASVGARHPGREAQHWQEVIFYICWGSPQDCRDGAKKQDQRTSGGPQLIVSVSYRVDCRDRDIGGNRADSTVTFTASTRAAVVAEIERLARSTDLCQSTGDSAASLSFEASVTSTREVMSGLHW